MGRFMGGHPPLTGTPTVHKFTAGNPFARLRREPPHTPLSPPGNPHRYSRRGTPAPTDQRSEGVRLKPQKVKSVRLRERS